MEGSEHLRGEKEVPTAMDASRALIGAGPPLPEAGTDAMDVDEYAPHPLGKETVQEAVMTNSIEEVVLNSSTLLELADQLTPDEPGWPDVADKALPENAGHMSVSLQRDADGMLTSGLESGVQLPAAAVDGHPASMVGSGASELAAGASIDRLGATADPEWKPPSSADEVLAKAPPVRVQRVQRQLKRKRDAEFLYEGDEDWETLIERGKAGHRRNLLGGIAATGPKGQRVEVEPGVFAAVTAGLKAKVLLPSELIRFKEQLKKRAGKEDYLAARNLVLALWEKDISRVLQLTDCKVTPTATPGESPGAPLIREVFEFLDRRGFINCGIAGSRRALARKKGAVSEKGDVPVKLEAAGQGEDAVGMTVEFLEADENGSGGVDATQVIVEPAAAIKEEGGLVGSEIEIAGVAAMEVAVETSKKEADASANRTETKEVKQEQNVPNDEATASKAEAATMPVEEPKAVSEKEVVRGLRALLRAADLQTLTERQLRKQLEAKLGLDLTDKKKLLRAHIEAFLRTGQVEDDTDDEDLGLRRAKGKPAVKAEVEKPGSADGNDEKAAGVLDSAGKKGKKEEERKKRRVVVVGAGPAGLAAARHMQRLGLEVIVIEARKRVGGRVHTDKKTFSAPVDLGASIITGIEADVVGERQPDPSALVCKQLGTECVPLGQLCPLYDVVTGALVTPEVDTALEAEFNALLDDTALIPADKAEVASMSLEEGLEAALLSRRQKARRVASSSAPQPNGPLVSRPSGDVDMDPAALAPVSTAVAMSVEAGTATSNEVALRLGLPVEEGSATKDLSSRSGAVVHSGQEPDAGPGTDHEENGLGVEGFITPEERRVLDWHYANLEYGCAAPLGLVSLPHWNQDDPFGGFGGAHCMVKGGYGHVIEALAEDLDVRLGSVVSEISYPPSPSTSKSADPPSVKTVAGETFSCDAVLLTAPLGCLKAGDVRFSPPLPDWKQEVIQRLGYGNLNKVVMQFPTCFWDTSVDYFGAAVEDGHDRGNCFMFWNLHRVCGQPILLALIVGEAAQAAEARPDADVIGHAVAVLRRLFGPDAVPEPSTTRVTRWGSDRFSRGAYSYVAVGATGKDYDLMAAPVEKALFFAGEATCREHPDTVGGAMLSGLREAVRIAHLLEHNRDTLAEEEALVSARKTADDSKAEIREVVYKVEHSTPETRVSVLESLLASTRTPGGRSALANKLVQLPDRELRSFAGTRAGLKVLDGWMADALAADTSGTQLLRLGLKILLVAAVDLGAVKVSGVARTVREKALAHPSREIRVLAKELVDRWIAIFKRQKALRLAQQRSVSPKLLAASVPEPTAEETQVVKIEEPVREEAAKELSEAELALKKAAEEAEAAALAAEEALKAAEDRLTSSMSALPEIVSFSKYAKKDKRPEDKRAPPERLRSEDWRNSRETASPAEAARAPPSDGKKRGHEKGKGSSGDLRALEKRRSHEKERGAEGRKGQPVDPRVRDGRGSHEIARKEGSEKDVAGGVQGTGGPGSLRGAVDGQVAGAAVKENENGHVAAFAGAVSQPGVPMGPTAMNAGQGIGAGSVPSTGTGLGSSEGAAKQVGAGTVSPEEEYDPFGEDDVAPGPTASALGEADITEASALLAGLQDAFQGAENVGQSQTPRDAPATQPSPGIPLAGLVAPPPAVGGVGPAGGPTAGGPQETRQGGGASTNGPGGGWPVLENDGGGSGINYEYDPAQTWASAEKAARRVDAAAGNGVKDRKHAVQEVVIAVLKPVYNSKGISKDDFKTILKKATAKVLERQTPAEKQLNDGEFMTSKRRSKIEALVEGYVEKYQAAASQKGRNR